MISSLCGHIFPFVIHVLGLRDCICELWPPHYVYIYIVDAFKTGLYSVVQ